MVFGRTMISNSQERNNTSLAEWEIHLILRICMVTLPIAEMSILIPILDLTAL